MRCKKVLLLAGLICLAAILSGCQRRSEPVPSVPEPTATAAPTPTPQPTPTPTPMPVQIAGVTASWDAQELDLTGAPVVAAEELAAALRQLPLLQTVDLRGWGLSNEDELALHDAFPGVSFLWEVDVLGVQASSTDEHIVLDDIPMTDTAELEKVLPLLSAVKKIDMCRCGLDDETMYELNQRHEDIEFVWLTYIGNSLQRTDITSFCANTVGVQVNASSEELMVVLKYFPNLVALDFGHSGWFINDLSWLERVPNLEVLILVDCHVRDVTPIAQLKELTYLELFTNPYLMDVAPLAQLPKLRDLNLSLTCVSDLTALQGMPSLRRLWVNGCMRLSAEQVDAFWRATPECGVSYMLDSSGALNGWRQDDRYFWMRDMFDAEYMPVTKEMRFHVTTKWYTPEGEEPRPMPTPTPREGLVPTPREEKTP